LFRLCPLAKEWRRTDNGHTDNEKPLESLVSSFQRSRYLLYSEVRLHLCRPVRFSIWWCSLEIWRVPVTCCNTHRVVRM